MSDLQSSSSSPVASPPMPGVSPGTLLRQARQAQGLHIETVAASLKVSVAKLQALENDQFDAFSDANFVRAFAGSVCRTLKIDAAPVLAALPPGALHKLSPNSEGINTRLRDERSRGLFTLLGGKWIALAVFALLLGALVLLFLPERPQAEAEPEASTEEMATPSEVPATTVPGSTPPVVAPAPAAVVAPAPAVPAATGPVVPPAASPVPMVPPASIPLSSAPPPPPVSSNSSPVAAAALLSASAASVTPPPSATAVAEVLVLSARASSWIRVRDSKGNILLKRTLGAGESVTVPHPPPLNVWVGRADMTDVYIRGERFEITGIARENVARFEVK